MSGFSEKEDLIHKIFNQLEIDLKKDWPSAFADGVTIPDGIFELMKAKDIRDLRELNRSKNARVQLRMHLLRQLLKVELVRCN